MAIQSDGMDGDGKVMMAFMGGDTFTKRHVKRIAGSSKCFFFYKIYVQGNEHSVVY